MIKPPTLISTEGSPKVEHNENPWIIKLSDEEETIRNQNETLSLCNIIMFSGNHKKNNSNGQWQTNKNPSMIFNKNLNPISRQVMVIERRLQFVWLAAFSASCIFIYGLTKSLPLKSLINDFCVDHSPSLTWNPRLT